MPDERRVGDAEAMSRPARGLGQWGASLRAHRLAQPLRGPYRNVKHALSPVAWSGAHKRMPGPAVALTFDDGPHPRFTHQVLDVLAASGVLATFFLVGKNARAHPRVVRRIVDEGHAVGSHSMTHAEPRGVRTWELWQDYRSGHLAVCDVVGDDTPLFRPPKGHLDRRIALPLRASSLRPWLWSVDAADWTPDVLPEEIDERLGLPKAGAVILLHDAIEGPLAPSALDRSATVEGLRRFLGRALRAGAQFVRLP